MIRLDVDLTNPASSSAAAVCLSSRSAWQPRAMAHFAGALRRVGRRLEGARHEDRAGAARVLEPANRTSSALRLAEPFDLRIELVEGRARPEDVGRSHVGRSHCDEPPAGPAEHVEQRLLQRWPRHHRRRRQGRSTVLLRWATRRDRPAARRWILVRRAVVGDGCLQRHGILHALGAPTFSPFRREVARLPVSGMARAASRDSRSVGGGERAPGRRTACSNSSAFRTDQRKPRSFLTAIPVEWDGHGEVKIEAWLELCRRTRCHRVARIPDAGGRQGRRLLSADVRGSRELERVPRRVQYQRTGPRRERLCLVDSTVGSTRPTA